MLTANSEKACFACSVVDLLLYSKQRVCKISHLEANTERISGSILHSELGILERAMRRTLSPASEMLSTEKSKSSLIAS